MTATFAPESAPVAASVAEPIASAPASEQWWSDVQAGVSALLTVAARPAASRTSHA
jgi:hypothetical protein